ncbi:hypothetical protein VTN49DRAFT_1496 [Thermomyces lanuginosus]|uniref:uncharacterized protein n=1 Tax=Thermomyces lanuginosus TaxID=5541 RepID=UPI0037423E3E
MVAEKVPYASPICPNLKAFVRFQPRTSSRNATRAENLDHLEDWSCGRMWNSAPYGQRLLAGSNVPCRSGHIVNIKPEGCDFYHYLLRT